MNFAPNVQLCRRARTCILIFLLLLIGITPGWSASVHQPPPAPLDGNANLEKRVQVAAEGTPVGDLLASLSRKTGVDLSASAYVAEDKVILFGPPRPLRGLLMDLAALFNDQWLHTTTSDGKDHYVLTRSPQAKNYEDGLARGTQNQMLATMEEQVRALGESPEQLRSRPQNDPIRASLLDDERRLATKFYAALNAEQRQHLFEDGHTTNTAFQVLTPEMQELLRKAFAARIAHEQQLAATENIVVTEGNTKITDGIRVSRIEELEQGAVRLILVWQSANSADLRLQMSVTAQLPIRHLDAARKLLPIHGNPYTSKPVRNDDTLPAPDAVAAARRQQYWIDALSKLSQTSGMQVLADYYRCVSVSNPPDEDKSEADVERASPLDHWCLSHDYLWWVQGKSLLLRCREWYSQRLYEAPDRWVIDTFSRIKANKGVPTYRDVARLQRLTSSQLIGLQRLAGLSVGSERELDGLSQLLNIVSENALADTTPLPRAVISVHQPPAGLTYQSLSAEGQNMIAPFWANAYPIMGTDSRAFSLRISYNYPPNANPEYKKQAQSLMKQIVSANAEGVDSTPLKKQLLHLQMQHAEQQEHGESKGASLMFLNLNWTMGSSHSDVPKSANHIALPMLLPKDRNDNAAEWIRIIVLP